MAEPTQVRLYHGDCLEVMPTLKRQSVSLIFADLPYTVTACKWDTAINLEKTWESFSLCLQKNGVVTATALMRFAFALMQSASLPMRYDLVWHKNRSTGFFNAKNAPLRAHEHVLIFGKGKLTYNPQMRATSCTRRGNHSIKPQDSEYLDVRHKQRTYVHTDKRYPHSIVHVAAPNAERGLHPTQKPVALLEWLIKTYTNVGDTVLDPVAGSGTTAIAALRTGRNVICIEKDATYFAIMQKRVAEEMEAMQQTESVV